MMTKKSESTDEALIASSLQRASRNREETAYHESGHVAAAWCLKLPIRGAVTIKADFTCRGSAAVGKLISAADQVEALSRALLGLAIPCTIRQTFQSEIQMLYAGRLAGSRAVLSGEATVDPIPREGLDRQLLDRQLRVEYIAMGSAAEKAGLRSSPSDDEYASDLLHTLSAGLNEEANPYGEWLWERTRRLVDSEPFWTITSAIAKALLALETLSMTATRKVIRDALQPSPGELERSSFILEPPTEGGTDG